MRESIASNDTATGQDFNAVGTATAGAARGDLAFWAEQVKDFRNHKAGPAYAQIVDALLDRRDLPATMGLLMQWLNQAVPGDLATSPTSIAGLLNRWIDLATDPAHIRPSPDHTRLVERFFAVLEANAESYWSVPRLDEELTQLATPCLLYTSPSPRDRG